MNFLHAKKFWASAAATFVFCSFSPQLSFSQTKANLHRSRESMPEVKLPKSISAPPGYCESVGGSKTFEKINSISVVQKPDGNTLDITVEIAILNPTGCKSGKPCPDYDDSPEYVNVWIDWNGDSKWELHEKAPLANDGILKDINYSGTMKATGSVEIPAAAKRPTWLRANLGWGYDPNDPCEPSWRWGDVADREVLWNLRVQEITATLDVEMADVPKPLWQASYDASGNIINKVDNRPVAAQLAYGYFYLPVKLISFPADFAEEPKTLCNWEVVGTKMRGVSGFNGKSGAMEIKLPPEIGFYQLELDFEFFGNKFEPIGKQKISLPLWVSYQEPKLAKIKRVWLEKAIQWTEGYRIQWSQGSINDHELAERIMNAIYRRSGWGYYTYRFDWPKLKGIEGQEPGGNCGVARDVWAGLLKTLGVDGISTPNHTGRQGQGFMAKPNYIAFGGLKSANGNAEPDDSNPFTSYDRWVFGSHFFGQKGEVYYDPTFNLISTAGDLYFHVAYDVLRKDNGVLTTSPGGPTIREDGQFAPDEGNWGKHVYKFSSNTNQNIRKQIAQLQSARFTGKFSEAALDAEGDGLFNQLAGTAEIEIITPGNYTVYGDLRVNETVIASRSSHFSADFWSETIGLQPGQYEVQPLFSGEEIFVKAQNGPYEMKLFIIDSAGAVVDVDSFRTAAYNFSDFGELPTRLGQISETARDLTNDGFFDEISTTFEIQVSLAGDYNVEVSLSHLNRSLGSINKNAALHAGNNPLALPLPTEAIAVAGLNGPYTLAIQVSAENGTQTAYQEIQTSNYLAGQFAPPLVTITGGISDRGIDSDGNGRFDSLQVSLALEARKAGNFTVLTWLANPDGEVVTWAESEKTLNVGSSSIILSFPGLEINDSQLDGPYTVSYATVTQDSFKLIFSATDLYTTQAYSFSQFEQAPPPLVIATGKFSESTVDADFDGLIDSLVIEIEVVPRDSGNVVALGRLVDSKNETILWTSANEFLRQGLPQGLRLKFDGRYIYGGLVDGPYQLRDLQIYHIGDPSQTVEFPEAHTTQFYQAENFEPAAVFAGTVSDSIGTPIPGTLLYIPAGDFDYTDIEGNYNVLAFEDNAYTMKIEGPDTSLAVWSVFVNGELVQRGDSVQAPAKIGEVTQVDFRSSLITAAPVHVKLPDRSAESGTTFSYPVEVGSVAGREVFSADMELAYDPAILRAQEASTAGTIAASWGAPTFNIKDNGRMRIAMAGATALADSGVLVYVKFDVVGTDDDTSRMRFLELTLNEGSPPVAKNEGLFRVGKPTRVEMNEAAIPVAYHLHQNHPNPFNPETRIQFDLPKSTGVRIEIYNVYGQKIRSLANEQKAAGSYSVTWDGRKDNGESAASGVYFYRLAAGGFQQTRKMALLR
jgi:hypothetical protein